jgi:cytochrome d ubiquinol oxidase subunit I
MLVMDVVLLSRLQFAVATMFHFLFVPLTLGLSILVALMESIYVKTDDEEYKRMAKFWGKIFLINFSVGIVTGSPSVQFGTNAGYSRYVGDVFGSLLAIEATVAFFVESTFIAIWVFGWNKVSPRIHAACIWLVAAASTGSAYWILVANTWMQNPVGYMIRGGRAELEDFLAVLTQPYAIWTFLHTTFAGYIVAGFFVMGVSAYHLLRKSNVSLFSKSFRIALIFALIFSVGEVIVGDFQGKKMGQFQPSKLAAVESQWETVRGAPFSMLLIPDEANERNSLEMFQIPKFLSYLVYDHWDAEIKGLKAWPIEDRPPVTLTFWSFRLMVGLGFLFALLNGHWLVQEKQTGDRSLVFEDYAVRDPAAVCCRRVGLDREGGGTPALDSLRRNENHRCGFTNTGFACVGIVGCFCNTLFTAWTYCICSDGESRSQGPPRASGRVTGQERRLNHAGNHMVFAMGPVVGHILHAGRL